MLIILHLALMIMATLCLMAGIGMAVFGRRKRNWLKRHRMFNTVGAILGLAGIVMAFTGMAASGEAHFTGIHHRLGLIAMLLIFFTLFWGYYSLTASNRETVRVVHRWIGRLALVTMLANLFLGLLMIGILSS